MLYGVEFCHSTLNAIGMWRRVGNRSVLMGTTYFNTEFPPPPTSLLKTTKLSNYFSYNKIVVENKKLVHDFMDKGIRVSLQLIDKSCDLERNLLQWNVPVGVLLDAGCENTENILNTVN